MECKSAICQYYIASTLTDDRNTPRDDRREEFPRHHFKLEWHISWYLNFLPGNSKNDLFPARKYQENQEKSIAVS